MTISQIIKLAIEKLNSKKISSPRLEADILLAKIIKKSPEFILAYGERELTKLQIVNYKLKIKKRLTGLPLAYLTGQKEFYGLNFKVNKNVLIPRPETELMVEEALKLIAQNSRPATIIDIGTGSGCIIITLAKSLSQKSLTINHELWGIDISAKVLAIAKQNAQTHLVNKKINFLKGNLLASIINNSLSIIHNSIIITANLPYLAASQIENSPTIKHEPRLALSGGKNGLELYEKLFKQIKELIILRRKPLDIRVLCEFDPGQTAKIKRLIKRELPEAKLQIKKDLAGLNRLAIIKIPSPLKGEG